MCKKTLKFHRVICGAIIMQYRLLFHSLSLFLSCYTLMKTIELWRWNAKKPCANLSTGVDEFLALFYYKLQSFRIKIAIVFFINSHQLYTSGSVKNCSLIYNPLSLKLIILESRFIMVEGSYQIWWEKIKKVRDEVEDNYIFVLRFYKTCFEDCG